MTYTDEQYAKFYNDVYGGKGVHRDDPRARIEFGRLYLNYLTNAGYKIEFPVCIEYKVHPVADPGSDRMWALYKYVNGERHTWIADFARKVHAEDLRDLLTNDLHPSGEC